MTDALLRCGYCGVLCARDQLKNCEWCDLLLCSPGCVDRHYCGRPPL